MAISPNMQRVSTCVKGCADIRGLVSLFERGTVTALEIVVALSPAEIIELKQLFVAKRNEVIAALNAISAND